MKCTSAEFENFRNIEAATLRFGDGVTVLFGENAQGKTNVIEGIYLFARGRSFRAAKEREAVRFGERVARIKLFTESGHEKMELGAEIPLTKPKSFYKNRIKCEKNSEIIGEFRAVLFCPSHLSLIYDGPAVRRNFLDIAISQIKPLYMEYLGRYNRTLLQRNALLKAAADDPSCAFEDMNEIYAEQLASLADKISSYREEYIAALDENARAIFREMTGAREVPTFRYKPSAGEHEDRRARYFHLLTAHTDREIRMGATLFGTHKDEIEIAINGREARQYASQGQQRSLALAMKLSEGEISYRESGEYPVFLLDDVLSELDVNRRAFVLSAIRDRQVIVTCCEPSDFSGAHMIRVSGGRYEE